MKTAKYIKTTHDGKSGFARLYHLSEPYMGYHYIVGSVANIIINTEGKLMINGKLAPSRPVSNLFLSNEKGIILHYGQPICSGQSANINERFDEIGYIADGI